MRMFCLAIVFLTSQVSAQPVEFDPSDFGKIVISPRQSTDGLTFEQAFGDYQNEPVIKYGDNGPAVRMGRPIGRLDLLYKSGKPGFCTAFIVDSQHIVTNHHCIPGMDGDPTGAESGVTAVQFVAGYINPGQSAGTDKYTVSPQIVETNRDLDYTVLQVFGDPSAKYGKMDLAAADPEDSEFLWIIGHPQGMSQHISREGCAASAPAISPEGKLVHTCDTLGGNSGSPVIRITDHRVIGLHNAGNSQTGFNQAIPMRRILEVSKVLYAAAAPATASTNETAAVNPADQVCTAMWGEAKNLGCLGYETYAKECASHAFSSFAKSYIEKNCSVADEPEPDVAAPRTEKPQENLALLEQCDRLAADPGDLDTPEGVSGVDYQSISAGPAIQACRAAVKAYPENPRMYYQLGRSLDVNGDSVEAVSWYEKAIELGHIRAQYALGFMYLEGGPGITLSDETAFTWLQEAAIQGHADAQQALGNLHFHGVAFGLSDAEAIAWLKKAAAQGHSGAQSDLAGYKDPTDSGGERAQKGEVVTTESGLQYRVLRTGAGAYPTLNDTVLVHYTGKLLDGTVFDSSRNRGEPLRLPVNGVIAGWVEALQLMQPGTHLEVWLRPDLAYGEQGAGDRIGPNETLYFEMELLQIEAR